MQENDKIPNWWEGKRAGIADRGFYVHWIVINRGYSTCVQYDTYIFTRDIYAHFHQRGLTLISVQLTLHLFLIFRTRKRRWVSWTEIKVNLHWWKWPLVLFENVRYESIHSITSIHAVYKFATMDAFQWKTQVAVIIKSLLLVNVKQRENDLMTVSHCLSCWKASKYYCSVCNVHVIWNIAMLERYW